MIIKNKIESIEMIKKLGLNKLPEGLFMRGEEDKVKNFLREFSYDLYAIRDKTKTGGVFKFNVKREDVLNEISGYDIFTINVSSGNYENHQLVTGDIKISSDGSVYAVLSTDPQASVRDAYKNSDININTDIFDKKALNKIPNFDEIYQYLYEHNLIDVIVEFSLFDIDVGIKNEKIIIWELRTNY